MRLSARLAAGPAAAAGLVAVAILAIWFDAGVSVDQVLRVVGYEALYVLLPGWVLHELLQPRTASALRRFAFSLALGQVVQILAFALTMAIGLRWLFTLYPLVFVALAVFGIRRGGVRAAASAAWTQWRVDRHLSAWSLSLAGVCILSLLALVLTHFLTTPLPSQISAPFTYQHDYIFHLSLAGEALHHWPLENPNVAGTPLRYHWFSYFQMAAMAQVTGVSLPTIYFAIFPVTLLALLVGQLAIAGSTLGGRLWAGPIAALMLIFVGEIDFSQPELAPFLEVMPIYLRYSPPFLFGATFFVPALVVLCETLKLERPSRAQWAMLALLLIGCAGAEAALLPLLGGAVAVYVAYRWLLSRRLEQTALAALGMTLVVFVLAGLALYSGSSSGLSFSFPAGVQLAPPFSYALPYVHGWTPLFWILASGALILALMGSTAIGLLWLPRRLRELRSEEVVPLALFVGGILAILFLFQESGSERYFAMYGAIAIIPVSAGGLVRLLERWRGVSPRGALLPALLGLAVAVACFLSVSSVHFGASPEVGPRYLRPYGILVAVLVALVVWVLLSPREKRGRRALYPVVVVLAAAAVNLPTDYRSWLGDLWSGEKVQAEVGPGLDPDYYQGLRWIRANTDDDAVLAVDDLRTADTQIYGPLYFYVAGFAERRTLMQGWEYSAAAARLGFTAVQKLEAQPFPERLELEDAVFGRGSAAALRTLQRRYGVTHLVVERRTGLVSPKLRRVARLVYSNPALLVFVPRP